MLNKQQKLLIIDDQEDILESLSFLLKLEGYHSDTLNHPKKVADKVKSGDYAMVICDLNYSQDTTSGQEGLALISQIKSIDPQLPVIAMTAWGSIQLVVDAIKLGATDFIEKPWDNQRLKQIVNTQMQLLESKHNELMLQAQLRVLNDKVAPAQIAHSPAMQQVLKLVESVAASDANLLITGENGSGKSHLVKYIQQLSSRADKRLITVNMGSLPESVFESEMFGHVKGAFTDAKENRIGRFELAHQGTLFMDEIANIPLSQQSRLLRIIEDGEFEAVGSSKTQKVDVRLISASNADFDQEIRTGAFRQDLFYRLNTIEVKMPPLRERTADILPLAESFLNSLNSRYRKTIKGFDQDAIKAMQSHPFKGNVRELSHAVERAVLVCDSDSISAKDLALRVIGADANELSTITLTEHENRYIKQMMTKYDGNVAQVAELLDISRASLYRRLEKLKIE